MGSNELSWRWCVRHLQDARDVSSWRNTGFPPEGDLYGNGVPIVIVRVTSHQGGWESHPQGKGAQVVRRAAAMRYAKCGEPQWRWASLAAFGRQDWPLESEVIRKRSRFVRRGAAGKGLSQDRTSLAAYST